MIQPAKNRFLCTLSATLLLFVATNGLDASDSPTPSTPVQSTPTGCAKIYDATKHREQDPGETFEVISEIADIWDVKKIQNKKIDHVLRDAQMASKANDYKLAEELFIKALNRKITSEERYWALLQMAAMYQRAGAYIQKSRQNEAFKTIFGERELLNDEAGGPIAHLVKASSVYEKFLALYKDDDLVPFVNLQLGRIYRKIGANELASARFYDVINATLKILPANIPAYEKVTLEAKQEIAETFFLQGKYKQSADFFGRLRLLELDSEARQKVIFKIAYSQYMLKNAAIAKTEFEKFLIEFPDSILTPESYYLLSKIYAQLNQPQNAVSAVLKLLGDSQVLNPKDKEIWLYWQKKAANEIANQFYEQSDYLSALKIYQAMWSLDTSAEWRAPTMYQIGLCFSRLDATQKAVETFDQLVKGVFWDEKKEAELYAKNFGKPVSDDVKTVQELAKWHAQNKAWNMKASNRIQRLMDLNQDGT